MTAVHPTLAAVRPGVTTCDNTRTPTNADLTGLSGFRAEPYACLPRYSAELFNEVFKLYNAIGRRHDEEG
ncbi:hypothetical protein [Actinomadura litoris]|uniref:hypothetical protein n=1 Tax=Actinomadura litoris TaxID=2678616 RepID=UPI001FA7862B|nr:hypothetical protein [Actinomadura litoris]